MKDPAQVARSLGITPAVVASRLELLGFGAADREHLRAARRVRERVADEFLDSLYELLLENPETATLLSGPAQIARLKEQQRGYLAELFEGTVDHEYVLRRLWIGVVHHRVRVSPPWYLATYAHFVSAHLDALFEASPAAVAHERLQALFKIICFDASLVLDAYGHSRETDLWARHRDEAGGVSPDPAEFRKPGASRPGEVPSAAFSRIPLTRENTLERRRFIGLDDADVERLRALRPLVQSRMSGILAEFYAFLAGTPELARHVPHETAERLVRQVGSYWLELCDGDFDRPYAASRLRIGVIHEKIGIGPEWYLAGLARQCTGLLAAIAEEHPGDVALVRAFLRAVFFDASFVLDAYMEARADSLLRADGFASQLVSGLPSAVAVFDARNRLVSANATLVALAGGDAGVLYLTTAGSALAIAGVEDLLRSAREQGVRRGSIGRLGARRVRMTALPLVGGDVRPGTVALVLDDVTELLELGADLDRRQGQFEQLADSAGAVLWELDVKADALTAINAAALELTGWRDVAFLGRVGAWFERVATGDRERLRARITALAPGGQDDVEYRFVRADGQERWFRTRLGRGRGPAEGHVTGVTLDLTSARRAEALRLEGIATIAGGVAHTVNNSLMGVLGNIEMYRDTAGRDASMEYLDAAVEAAAKASEMASRLLAFAGQQPLRPEPAPLDALVRASMPRLQALVGSGVRVRLEERPVRAVRVDVHALETALESLAANAREAMEGSGTFDVLVHELQGGTLPPTDEAFGRDWIEVVVSDSGRGMRPEVRERALEPFFTTRSLAEASGLGLSMVHGFLLQSGGHVRIVSDPGQGTRVALRFPAPELPEPPRREGSRPVILLVEDDAEVRRIFVSMVRHLGHVVVAAASGEEARRLAARERPSVLFTDIVLGSGGDGIQLAQELAAADPTLSIVLVSGFAKNRFDLSRLDRPFEYLAKPFTLAALARCLEASLQRES